MRPNFCKCTIGGMDPGPLQVTTVPGRSPAELVALYQVRPGDAIVLSTVDLSVL